MKQIYLLTVFLLFCFANVDAGVSQHDEFYCFNDDPIRPQNSMFSTQSGYEGIRGRNINPSVSSCQPSRFWLVARHGGRNPPAATVQLMRDFASGPVSYSKN